MRCANRIDILEALRPQVYLLVVSLVSLALVAGCGGGQLSQIGAERGIYHSVQRGQTLWGIAQQYGADVHVLARVNKLPDASVLQIGQRLYIPGAMRQQYVVSHCPCPSQNKTVAHHQRSGVSGLRTNPVGSERRDQSKTPASSTPFVWPVQGTVTRGFKQGGKHRHDGIDIAAPKGTPIMAAASGKVIFSDWGPGGYGRIVILRHAADIVTVYAHNHRNLVKVGQRVRRGDRIATVGRSGRATGYHLHFEVRRKTVPVPPARYLTHDPQLVQLEHR